MQQDLHDCFIWISFDESTDATGRPIGIILAAKLSKNMATLAYMLCCEELDEVNNKSVSQACLSILRLYSLVLYLNLYLLS